MRKTTEENNTIILFSKGKVINETSTKKHSTSTERKGYFLYIDNFDLIDFNGLTYAEGLLLVSLHFLASIAKYNAFDLHWPTMEHFGFKKRTCWNGLSKLKEKGYIEITNHGNLPPTIRVKRIIEWETERNKKR